MRIALGIYRLSPRGGLEDQCIRLAEILQSRGHEVTAFTALPVPPLSFETKLLAQSPRPFSNHARMGLFARDFIAETDTGYDRRVVFQPVPGADILFCADMPKKPPNPFLAWLPGGRRRVFSELEAGCFGRGAKTRIICLARPQANAFVSRHETESGRIALMPPSISIERRQCERRRPANRSRLREALGLRDGEAAWLWLGLHPRTKGLDRAISALAGAREGRLFVGGIGEGDKRAHREAALARRLGVADRIRWLGYLDTDGVLDAMAAADLLVHPARLDVTGAVIVESIVNGLPAVVTGNCGFAYHVKASGAGRVVEPPFSQTHFEQAITAALEDSEASSARGIAYGLKEPLYDGLATAADMIEADDWTGRDWLLDSDLLRQTGGQIDR